MRGPCLLAVVLAVTSAATAGVFVRWNQAGYGPEQPKHVLVMSDQDLRGADWTVERVDSSADVVLRGVLNASVAGTGEHTPLAFNHVVDLSTLRVSGLYQLHVDGAPPAEIRVAPSPYARLLELPLRHLRVGRSGSDATLLRASSHPGDARAPLFISDGDPEVGRWKPAEPARMVDVLGGWYDAGDQIKFTLTNAYTTYFLLFAHRLAPDKFGRSLSRSELPDVLDEARHGLEFLLRVHPDRDTFVIQVGNAEDHNQGERLPEHDKLDGKRPAMSALSRVHMASTAAALAIGAQTFGQIGRTEDATRYAEAARTIYARACEPDTIVSAFERDQVNDFYHDPSDADQLALAAVELYALTGEPRYLEDARRWSPPAGREAGWADWHWVANFTLAAHDANARERLLSETDRYARHAAGRGMPWGLPGRYVWGSLHRWIGSANAARLAWLHYGAPSNHDALYWSVVDYTFGRNNWGVSFLFDRSLPNTLHNLYSPLYRLLGEFPTGALSEGPGNRDSHDRMARYFTIAADDPFHRFNTPAAVFFDNPTDFMCQEATIGGQADLVLLLVLASVDRNQPGR